MISKKEKGLFPNRKYFDQKQEKTMKSNSNFIVRPITRVSTEKKGEEARNSLEGRWKWGDFGQDRS